MSTIAFTPIQGYLALPRARPLVHVPAPFGRDWALLPPGYSLRAELKALYAAMLRTFCLSDQAIRSLCRWSPLSEQRAVAAADEAGSAAIAEQARVFGASSEAAAHAAVEPPVALSSVASVVGEAARRDGNHWGALAGGVCVLGGAAVLAWIGFDHLAQRQTAGHVAGNVPTRRDSRIVDVRPPATVSDGVVARASANASGAVAVSAPALPALPPTLTATASSVTATTVSAMASASASASVPTRTSPPTPVPPQALPSPSARNSADKTGSFRRQHPLEHPNRQPEQKRRHDAGFAAIDPSLHATAFGTDLPHVAASRMAAGLPPAPSTAGSYSPPAPTRLGVDEYAGVTMSAALHRHDIASLAHPSSSTTASGNGATEWINHLSQRRVTEIPDQFAK